MKGGSDNVAIIRVGKCLQRRLQMLVPFDHCLWKGTHHRTTRLCGCELGGFSAALLHKSRESIVVGGHEQTHTPRLQDQELAEL